MVRTIPKWQRYICGTLSELGSIAIFFQLIEMIVQDQLISHWEFLSLPVGVYGCFLFGYFAIRGRLPGERSNN